VLRLRSMVAGSVIEEAAFYSGGGRTADLVAEQDSVVYSISRERLEAVEDRHLVRIVYELIGVSIAVKLDSANSLIQVMTGEDGGHSADPGA